MNLNFSDYIKLKTNFSMQYFLVDSQADISIIKINSLAGRAQINRNETIEINGVVKTTIQSIGTVILRLQIENITIDHRFHVMPDDFNIPCDCIIGKDFIKLYRAVLDYGDHTFTVRTHLGDYVIPMSIYSQNEKITIPPRSETF